MPKYRKQSNTDVGTEPVLSQADFYEALYQLIRGAVRTVLEEVMREELNEFIQVAA